MEPFKESLNADVVRMIGQIIDKAAKLSDAKFSRVEFENAVVPMLPSLELRQRVNAIVDAVDQSLIENFEEFKTIILGSLHPSEDTARDGVEFGKGGLSGFAIWPITELVTRRALAVDAPEEALALLKECTKRSTSEFAIRPIIERYPEVSFQTLMRWTKDENRHVRRLASEGSRPRLPWGMQLKDLVNDPAPLFPLITALRDDPEEYVRRSVANNLNDIAKDHPEKVAEIAGEWLKGAENNRYRLVKHACRTLIKARHPATLSAFGYHPIKGLSVKLDIKTLKVVFGDSVEFDLALDKLPIGQKVMVDYVIHFVKANGSRSAKVFKWKDFSSQSPEMKALRRHTIKPITTRKYYEGKHLIEIIVNGISVAQAEFELAMK